MTMYMFLFESIMINDFSLKKLKYTHKKILQETLFFCLDELWHSFLRKIEE